MLSYKEKHGSQLQLGKKLRQLGVILPMAATLSMDGCGHSVDNSAEKQEYGLLAHDSIEDQDYFGRLVTLKHVSVNLYKDKKMKPTHISQLRWGTPKEDMPEIYQGEKTFAKKVRYGGENDFAFIEVFENEYGVLISKDQPCFIVDKHNTLVYLGNAETFNSNMHRYVSENHLDIAKTKPVYERYLKSVASIDKDSLLSDTVTDGINVADIDSFLDDTDDTKAIIKSDSDSVQKGQFDIDTMLIRKDNPVYE
jgi:hypothetical protein